MKKIFLMMVAMMVSVATFAQVTTSAITGRVTTEAGEDLVGATVIATHTPSGTEYGAVVNNNGRYNIQGMRAGGPYTVVMSYIGYASVEFTGVDLPLGETATRDGYLSEDNNMEAIVVSIDGAESAMNVKRSGASTSISSEKIEMMPSVSRSMNDIMRLTPQASSSGSNLSIGGGNYRQSYVTVDGAAFNNAFGIGSNLPAGGTPISLEALDMISVSVTPYDVRQSGFTGGSISAVTKSGTNNLEISVYDFYESDALQGTKLANGAEVTPTESLSNTVGINIGAPIIKDKLFIFANFEYEATTSPGTSRLARTSEDESYGWDTNYNRPTVDKMEEIRDYLIDTYDYDPGRYQNYSIDIPNYKFMARLDWNINDNHRMNARFSRTTNKYSNSPSSSISPLSSAYDRSNYGRTTTSALYFESARYYQEQNFTSVAAELNSRFLDGKLNNILRVTYSHQYEPRSFEGDLFPTVDILETDENGNKAVYTTFGVDPFTYGNLRDVSTYVVTDEVTYTAGKHNLLAGVQFEHNNTKNGFMQGGAGYYVFDSWDDFVNNSAPLAFAMTHANRDDLQQVYPQFNYIQYSAYLQDEINFSDRFKATVGVRFEVPVMPSMANNENKEFTELFANYGGYKTSDMPAARLNIAPRVGFNYDLTGERKYVLRGGSGLYTGRIPFVWIVSAFGNSNCLQAQTVMDSNYDGNLEYPLFSDDYNGILENLYGGSFESGELSAPTSTTIMDTDLKMSSTWKSSLAFEANLPSGFHFTLEGIYNKDLNSVVTQKLGIEEVDGGVQLPGEPEARSLWTSQGIKNSDGSTVAPYYLTNSAVNGYYSSITAQVEKSFNFGLNLSASYTYSDAKSVTDGTGDQVSSSYYSGPTYNRNGSNTAELGYSSFVTPNRLLINASYRKEYGNNFATSVGLYYEGAHVGYYGGYSYSRYSYTMGNVTGDGGNAILLYVPTDSELAAMPFSDDDQRDAFGDFINNDKYLSSIKGEYSERGGAVAPWHNTFSLKVAQDFYLNVNGNRNTLTVGLDVENVGNLVNRNWGNYEYMSSVKLLSYSSSTGQYSYSAPNSGKYVSSVSAWSALFSIRYTFK
ncbi:MAG: carboxypeptidase regulatory-like domain-containing protein [Rikenellaceae bacterium]